MKKFLLGMSQPEVNTRPAGSTTPEQLYRTSHSGDQGQANATLKLTHLAILSFRPYAHICRRSSRVRKTSILTESHPSNSAYRHGNELARTVGAAVEWSIEYPNLQFGRHELLVAMSIRKLEARSLPLLSP